MSLPRSATLVAATLAATLAAMLAAAPLATGAPLLAQPTFAADREQTADQQVRHALDRLAFGPRPGDVARVRAMGVDAWIEQQLHPERLDDGAMTTFLDRFPSLDMTGAQLLAQYPPPGQTLARLQREAARTPGVTPTISREDSLALRRAAVEGRRVVSEVGTARVARAVASERQLEEVLVDFWANHFTVFAGKERVRYFIPTYDEDVIRPHVLGSFRDLLGAVAHSEAMLYFLDNWQSIADSGRTTLAPRPVALGGTANARGQAGMRGRAAGRGGAARERAMQRATIGQIMDADRLPPRVQQQLERLDADELASVRGMTLEQARTYFEQRAGGRRPSGLNENYARELLELHTLGVDGGYSQQDVIDVARALTGWTIARGPNGGGFAFRPELHDAEAKTILGVHFPAGRGVEEGEAVLDLLASHPATARHIARKLAVRFVSDEPPAALIERVAQLFLDTNGDLRAVTRAVITSPEFFAADAYRAKVKSPFELVVSAARALGAAPDATPRTALLIAQLGQPLYGHQAPDGWPETGEAWINTGSILNRMNFGLAVGAGRLPNARLRDWPAARDLEGKSREAQVDVVIRELLGGHVSPDTRAVLVSGTNPLLAAAPAGGDAPMAGDGDAPRMDRRSLPALTGPAQIIGLAIGAPEFQRR